MKVPTLLAVTAALARSALAADLPSIVIKVRRRERQESKLKHFADRI